MIALAARSLAMVLLVASVAVACRSKSAAPAVASPRVVSLAPNLTEIVYAIGAGPHLVGRTTACDFPSQEVARVPAVGGFGEPSMELLLAARPDVILDVALSDTSTARKMAAAGLQRSHIPCSHLDEIPVAIRTVGRLVGRDSEAEAVAGDMRRQIDALRAESATRTNRPTVLVEIWGDPVMTAGRGSFISELVGLAGGRNMGDEVDTEYYAVSAEWVVSRNPDIILCLYMAQTGTPRQQVATRQGWDTVAAVRTGRVYDGFDNNMILRPGPRVLQSIDVLRRRIAGTP